ncbi:probable ubiquitin-conjugating enzyme E2 C isoform X2 [Hyalella azteca]|uniref:Probable ubiquitin-conjugating enzyme E2 C isoform X2 n=1 Tax=Hyalella azteca TaxID=294128 RepID=A0A8B7PIE5_HYAAZ|nr:probable ubiquitin-conjugating enzyme E2 C isoform X2 [Hyalella azteca]
MLCNLHPSGSDFLTSVKLQGELMRLMMNPNKEVSAFPEGDNLFKWIATIQGPKETVYESLTYKLSLTFPSGYPYSPPTVKFITECFHPNVDLRGNICLDILAGRWSPLMDVHALLISLQSLLAEPNVSSPLNSEAAQLWPNQVAYKKQLLALYDKANREDKPDTK